MSKMQQDALSKVREDAEVQDEQPNETPSLNPATSKVSASSQNDIEALYLKEMTKTSDAPDTQLGPEDTQLDNQNNATKEKVQNEKA
jgi:hypothetical protein